MFRVLVSEFRVELPVAAAVSVVASDVVSELAASEVAVEEPSATAGEAENHGGGKRRCHEFFHFLSLLRNSIRKTFARGFALDVRFPPI